jgi:hypothetical protein
VLLIIILSLVSLVLAVGDIPFLGLPCPCDTDPMVGLVSCSDHRASFSSEIKLVVSCRIGMEGELQTAAAEGFARWEGLE